MSEITPEMVEEAMDNQYDGIEDCVLVEEILQLKADLATAREENQSFGDVLAGVHRDGGHYISEHGHKKASKDAVQIVLDLRAENKRLREFARFVIEQECWSIFEQDGHSIEELAEKLGLIVSHTVTKDEADENFGEGDTKFLFSETMKEVSHPVPKEKKGMSAREVAKFQKGVQDLRWEKP